MSCFVLESINGKLKIFVRLIKCFEHFVNVLTFDFCQLHNEHRTSLFPLSTNHQLLLFHTPSKKFMFAKTGPNDAALLTPYFCLYMLSNVKVVFLQVSRINFFSTFFDKVVLISF